MVDMAITAVLKVVTRRDDQSTEVDIKRYVRIEKIPGGELSDCCGMLSCLVWSGLVLSCLVLYSNPLFQ
jgi:hypothetical protein